MEQQCISKQAKDDRDQELMEAKHYRELAKQNKFKERREKYSTIRAKALIEVVRDFWRNKTVDGNSTSRDNNQHNLRSMYNVQTLQ